jgi:hypothetical protein
MSTKITAEAVARDAKEFIAFKRAMGTGYQRAEYASFMTGMANAPHRWSVW